MNHGRDYGHLLLVPGTTMLPSNLICHHHNTSAQADNRLYAELQCDRKQGRGNAEPR